MKQTEALVHASNGKTVRRPHWHKHNYLFGAQGEYWVQHRPYYPSRNHARTFDYNPAGNVNDTTTDDWEFYAGDVE